MLGRKAAKSLRENVHLQGVEKEFTTVSFQKPCSQKRGAGPGVGRELSPLTQAKGGVSVSGSDKGRSGSWRRK